MLGTAIIIFREVLEAALIIGILAAATRTVANSRRWMAGGVVLGLLGSVLVAASTDVIGNLADGMGQEVFNASVLGVAVLMLAWHNIWMAAHGATLAADAKAVGGRIREGISESSALLVIVGMAVLREGSESVLFLYGIATSGETRWFDMLLGGSAGLLAGMIVGYSIYAGLTKLPVRWFFSATSVLVLLLAASLAAQAAHFLIQADMLPSLAAPLWDTSDILSEKSAVGMLLHTLIGYDAQPSGMQMLFYASTIVLIGTGMYAMKASRTRPSSIQAA